MLKKILVVLVLALAALLIWLALFWKPESAQTRQTALIAAPPTGGEFTLQAAQGPVSLKDYRGKVVLVYFGYTYCPDICPTALAFTAQGLKLLTEDELAKTQVLFISVDPERDTPEKLKDYGTFFHPNILGLTGTPTQIGEAAKLYGASYRKQDTGSAGGYVVDHSSNLYVLDTNGKLAATLPHGTMAKDIAIAIRTAMSQKPD
ncbi:MAG: SCO family protein [Sulfuricellaceae bacterium]|nr:SCO family protein [Sulfuricellaceae bacterium]